MVREMGWSRTGMGSWEGTGVDLIRTCYCILKKNELGLSVLGFELQEE